MICDICGKDGAKTRFVSRVYGEGADLVVIEHVPVIFCSNCHESYLTLQTVEAIDEVIERKVEKTARRQVAVATLA